MTEAEMRDYLAKHLDILGPNLQLIGKPEFRLVNPNGSDGRIDLFARDTFYSVFVPIELKKSSQTARQAIHEVFKYVALLCVQEGISSDNVRPIVASTDWGELITPFSEFARAVHYQVRGLQIHADSSGIPIRTTEIKLLSPQEGISFCPEHLILLYQTPERRENHLKLIEEQITKFEFNNCLVVVQDYEGPLTIPYPCALYFATAALSLERCARMDEQMGEEFEWEFDEDDLESRRWKYESKLISDWGESLYILGRPPDDLEAGDPLKLSHYLAQGNWRNKRLLRYGNQIQNSEIHLDTDLITSLCALSGGNDHYFSAVSNPILKQHWTNFAAAIGGFFLKQHQLQNLVLAWLSEREAESDIAVHANIFFRNNIVLDLWSAHTYGEPPIHIDLFGHRNGSSQLRVLSFEIMWDGYTHPQDPQGTLSKLFDSGFGELGLAIGLIDDETADTIMRWLGFEYAAIESVISPSHIDRFSLALQSEGGIERTALDEEQQGVKEFMECNSSFMAELSDYLSGFILDRSIET